MPAPAIGASCRRPGPPRAASCLCRTQRSGPAGMTRAQARSLPAFLSDPAARRRRASRRSGTPGARRCTGALSPLDREGFRLPQITNQLQNPLRTDARKRGRRSPGRRPPRPVEEETAMAEGSNRTRYALVGVGNRGTTMWGRELLAGWGDYVELVGICDLNPMRAERARAMIGSAAPLYADFPQMMAELKPELVVVCTPDDTHDDIIVEALEAGADVIS